MREVFKIKSRVMDFILEVLENRVRIYTLDGKLLKEFNTFKVEEHLVHNMVFNWFRANKIKVSKEDILRAFGKQVKEEQKEDIFLKSSAIKTPPRYILNNEIIEAMTYVPLQTITNEKDLKIPYDKFVNKKSLTTAYKVSIFDSDLRRVKKLFPLEWTDYRTGTYGEWSVEIHHSMGHVNLTLQLFAFNIHYHDLRVVDTILPGTHLSVIHFDYNMFEQSHEMLLYFIPRIGNILAKRPLAVVGFIYPDKENSSIKNLLLLENRVNNWLSIFRRKYKMPYALIRADITNREDLEKIRSQLIRSIVLNYF